MTFPRTQKRFVLCSAWLGALLGIAVFLLVYGFSTLDVTNVSFCINGFVEKDIRQHYAGWLFYRQSTLQFPLGMADAINSPAGLSVAYTDSIPLFAIFFRLFSGFLPTAFQYFGWYTLLCFALQGAFAGALLALLLPGQPLFGTALGSLLFSASPVLLERAFRHTSLGTQWLILAALYFYFLSHRENRFAYRGLLFLNLLAITIHPYFVPMTFAITLALLLEWSARNHQWKGPALFLCVNLLGALLTGWCIGLFKGGSYADSLLLYGYFGLNLNALWNPTSVGGTIWSRLLPVQNQVGGNYDAFAYLGFGILVALVLLTIWQFAVCLVRRSLHSILAHVHRHWALCLICIVLAAFAVSNVVTANGTTLFMLPLPTAIWRLCSAFRSSGRLFWPVYYLLLLTATVGICRFSTHVASQFFARKRVMSVVSSVAILALVVLQLWDISPAMTERNAQMRNACAQKSSVSLQQDIIGRLQSVLQQSPEKYRHLVSIGGPQQDATRVALLAAQCGLSTTDPFAARYDVTAYETACSEQLARLTQGLFSTDTIYVFADEGQFLTSADALLHFGADVWCGKLCQSPETNSGEPSAFCADGCWYLILPGRSAEMNRLANELPENVIPYDETYPLLIADYTDSLWSHGVLNENHSVVCFEDSPFVRRKLVGATALMANGVRYPILNLDDSDYGWLMLTLDTEDAAALQGAELETEHS